MNKKIDIYTLLGLIKDGKAPKKIDYYGDIYVFAGDDYSLNDKKERWFITQYDYVLAKFMQEEVEILDEEDEFIDIEELGGIYAMDGDYSIGICNIQEKLNKLIKNQKKIIERLDKNE